VVRLRGDHAYRAWFVIPLVGYAAVWIHSRPERLVMLGLGAVLLLFTGWSLIRTGGLTPPSRSGLTTSPSPSGCAGGTSPPSGDEPCGQELQ
jgi:hypothetical protein